MTHAILVGEVVMTTEYIDEGNGGYYLTGSRSR
jgi:hypothetical protein